ncbi:hypothetical protein [Streptomyces sp. NPDC056512]|uniref:hypothetical protein n=1 Tax=Streptomyces sp. NPDC056512 TaxID=3345846 RepID=UPI0036A9F2E0
MLAPVTPEVPEDRPAAEPAKPSIALSWTGKEPLATYTDTSAKRNLAFLNTVVLMLALPGTLLPLLLHRIKPAGSGQNDAWMALFILSGVGGLLALLTLFIYLPVLTVLHRTPGWSLTIGPRGIEVSSTAGRREFRWKDLDKVAVEKIDGRVQFFSSKMNLYEQTGIHIKLAKGGAQKAPSRPAGWPPWYPGSIVARKDKIIPVCVLGPMTAHQRAELRDALSAYHRQ